MTFAQTMKDLRTMTRRWVQSMGLRKALVQPLSFWLSFCLASSCVQVDPKPDFDEAHRLIEKSTGRKEAFDPYAPALTKEELSAILADGLSLDEALRLALINNRALQAGFQEIGLSHADWVQSQLLSNPSFDLLLRFPLAGGKSMLEAIIGMELLELWRIPARKEAARHDLEATVLRIARRAGERMAEARTAYLSAVAAEELHLVAQDNVKLAKLSYDSVKSLHKAGAADAFDENLALGPLLSAELVLRTTRIKAANAKRDLAKTISVDRPVDHLALTSPLPERAKAPDDTEALVQQALASRLDLQAFAIALKALDARLRLEQKKAWGDVFIGVSSEKATGSGNLSVGPALGLTLPIFDQNQAQVARAGFQLEQMVKLYESAQIKVAQNVRSSADRVRTSARSLEFYEKKLLPQAEKALDLARESYAAGRSTLLALVEVQRQLLVARRGHVALRLEAAASTSDLQRIVGAPLEAR
jgi:outer membrane protein, heavy metal efflux system